MKTVDFLKPEDFPQNKDRNLIHSGQEPLGENLVNQFTIKEDGKKCYSVKLKRSVRFGSSGK